MRTLTLIIAVAGAYALLRGWPGAPGLLLRCCLAIATLVAGLAFWGARKERSAKKPRMLSLRRATLLDYLSLGAAIVFTEACFVALTSTLAGPAQEFALFTHDQVADVGQGGGAGGSGESDTEPIFDGTRSGNWLFKKDLARDLPKTSNHKPTNKPEVFVELENSEDATALLHSRIHLRAFAFSKFDGVSWSATQVTNARIQAPIDFKPPNNLTTKPIRHRIFHAVNPNGQNVFTALHGAISTDLPELTQLAEDVFLLPKLDDPIPGYNYTASSRSVHLTDLLDEELTPGIPADGELDLPGAMADQLRQTASLFQNEPDLTSRLLALQHHLQDNYQYSLETKNPSGANPLENFLYREKRGYCEHFATAAAMLCRALSVPSRIAYGWSGGRLYKEQNMFVFRAKDAHAWTEIKLHGYGWVVFDTTPPDDDATPDSHLAPDDDQAPDPEETIASEYISEEAENNDPGMGTGVNLLTLGIALGVVSVCAIGFLITRHLKQPQTTPDGRPLARAEPGYLLHFKQACTAIGHPMPLGRTLRQHIATLKKTDYHPDFADQMLDYHYGVLYGDADKNSTIEKQLNKVIRQWKVSAAKGNSA